MDGCQDPQLRPAQADDLDEVATVWFESASRMEGASAMLPSREELRVRIDRELAAGWLLYVALSGGRIVGMLALKPADAKLDQLFVHPADQGRGVGRVLLGLAKSALPGGFSLRTPQANRRGRRFYERHGLDCIGEGVHPGMGTPVCFYGWRGLPAGDHGNRIWQ
ncbi:GNAT family N-acetyltransferase [Azospirillum picis]|uniref:GNAT superfamily N-acetyltransferase n=1 Tax=Azospirillum picis TaxID=488438 RepID=A0ABU0MN01_9PROT|nr:GNAT family N-acetyltransferase [Azospirillum picis]MBP2301185.1 GNAT superfamily N-acetyltransferase [Azospirillum picis]MDQ0534852.1 GNAT superfamily N-acetyltransferase [Azospirillum picis]